MGRRDIDLVGSLWMWCHWNLHISYLSWLGQRMVLVSWHLEVSSLLEDRLLQARVVKISRRLGMGQWLQIVLTGAGLLEHVAKSRCWLRHDIAIVNVAGLHHQGHLCCSWNVGRRCSVVGRLLVGDIRYSAQVRLR